MLAPRRHTDLTTDATFTPDEGNWWSAAVLARLAAAVFVADAEGRILFRNPAAERLAQQCQAMCRHSRPLGGSRMTPTCPRLTGILRAAATSALDRMASGDRSVLIAQRPWGTPLEVVSVCLDCSPDRSCARGAAVAIFVSERSGSASVSDRELGTLYGLTPAEARVARLLAGGRSVGDITRELCLSPNTVRTQLKAAFAKTGTNHQSELAALIARSVASVVC